MWSAIRWLVVRIAAIRWFFKLGWLGLLVPIALILKTIGLPLLIILGVIAIPALFLLFLFGLPIILVLMFGGLLMGFLGVVLTVGVVAVKIALLVVLPAWLIWKLGSSVCGWTFKRGGNGKGGGDVPPSSASDAAPPPADGADPA